MAYAGFWRRFGAMFIDSILVSIGAGIILFALQAIIHFVGRASGASAERARAVAMLVPMVVILPLYLVYFAGFESSASGATPGKRALGIAVTDDRGRRLGFGQALARNAASLSAMILYIGFLVAAFTARKQALHDLTTGCLVIRRRALRRA